MSGILPDRASEFHARALQQLFLTLSTLKRIPMPMNTPNTDGRLPMLTLDRSRRLAAGVSGGVLLAAILIGCASDGSQHADAGGASCAVDAESARTASSNHAADAPTLDDTAPADLPGLHNVVAYHDGYYSGSAPHGEEAFRELAAMGVKTIISVDGSVPDVEMAHRYGIKYIHLPIRYNGFDDGRKLELVRATRDSYADGPVYVHCHHGKHRSAGAAGTAAVALGWMTPEEAIARMKVSGTSPSYPGLYACAANAQPMSDALIDVAPAVFPEVSRPEGMVAGMVEIDHATEHLKWIEAAGWDVPKDHPDLVPAAEAGQLADHLRLLAEQPNTWPKAETNATPDAEFGRLMLENAAAASALEEMLVTRGEAATGTARPSNEQLSAAFEKVVASCKDCHGTYRNKRAD